TPVALADNVTVLVGKNESGKTAFLEALYKALPLGHAKYDYVADYPRKDLVRYRPQHSAGNYQKVVQLTFRIEKELVDCNIGLASTDSSSEVGIGPLNRLGRLVT